MDIADGKIGVQCLLKLERSLAGVVDFQRQIQLPANGDPVVQERRQGEDQFHNAIGMVGGRGQIPVRQPGGAVRGRGGVGWVRAEPREDDRDAAADRFIGCKLALPAHEQNGAFAVRLKEGDMGAVRVDGGVGLRAGHREAGESAGAGFEFDNVRHFQRRVVHGAGMILP